MFRFCRGDRRIMRDQPHLDRNLPRWRIGIRAYQEEAPAFGQPFIVNPLEHTHRIVKMLQHMRQNDVVVAARQCYFLKQRVEIVHPIAQFALRFLHRSSGGFDAGDIVEVLKKTPVN